MKQAIVTGAGGGLGFSICKSLSENNFSVAAVDLNLTDSEKTSDKLNNTKPYAADVRDEESINSDSQDESTSDITDSSNQEELIK